MATTSELISAAASGLIGGSERGPACVRAWQTEGSRCGAMEPRRWASRGFADQEAPPHRGLTRRLWRGGRGHKDLGLFPDEPDNLLLLRNELSSDGKGIVVLVVSGNKQVNPMSAEGERRLLKCRKDYEIVVEQFGPLMDKIDSWLEQHRAPEESPASDVEDSAPPEQVRLEGLADTIRRFLRELDGRSAAGTSGDATDQKPKISR